MEMPDVIYASRSKYKTINTGNWSIHKVPTSAASQKPIRGKEKEEKDTTTTLTITSAFWDAFYSFKSKKESINSTYSVVFGNY